MKLIVIDLEFNQKSPKMKYNSELRQEIIEIGAVKLDNFKIEDNKFHSFVKPVDHIYMNKKVMELTKIDPGLVRTGQRFFEAIEYFLKWAGKDFILCCWGIDDIKQLNLECKRFDINRNFLEKYIDVQEEFMKVFGEKNRTSLKKAISKLKIEHDLNLHRAVDDAVITSEILKRIYTDNITIKQFIEKQHKNKQTIKPLEKEVCNLEFTTKRNKNQEKVDFLKQYATKIRLRCPKCGRFTAKKRIKHQFKKIIFNTYCKNCDIEFNQIIRSTKNEDQLEITIKYEYFHKQQSQLELYLKKENGNRFEYLLKKSRNSKDIT